VNQANKDLQGSMDVVEPPEVLVLREQQEIEERQEMLVKLVQMEPQEPPVIQEE